MPGDAELRAQYFNGTCRTNYPLRHSCMSPLGSRTFRSEPRNFNEVFKSDILIVVLMYCVQQLVEHKNNVVTDNIDDIDNNA